jgi:hypothetical protein
MSSSKGSIIVAVCLIGGGGFWLLEQSLRQESIRLGTIELRNSFHLWVSRGRPEGKALEDFLRDFPPDHLVPSNRTFVIDGMVLVTKFAHARHKDVGTLFMTTNGVLIFLDSTDKVGRGRIVSREFNPD